MLSRVARTCIVRHWEVSLESVLYMYMCVNASPRLKAYLKAYLKRRPFLSLCVCVCVSVSVLVSALCLSLPPVLSVIAVSAELAQS